MNSSYPFTPYGFYSPPDKYTEMPYQITNYTGELPVVEDTTPQKEALKQRVKDETQNSLLYGNLFDKLTQELEGV